MDKQIEKKTWTVKRLAFLIIGGIVAIFVGYNFFVSDHGSKLNIDGERVTVTKVEKGPFQEFIPVNGIVFPIKSVYLDAIQGGQVEKIFVEDGTHVKKGDSILQLTNTNLLLDIMHREAQLFEQINNLRNTRVSIEQNKLRLQGDLIELDYQLKDAKRKFEQNSVLIKKKSISLNEFDRSKEQFEYLKRKRKLTVETQKQDSIFRALQVKGLEISVDRMQKNLDVVKTKLESLILRAPISGQLSSLNAELGESKSPGVRLGQIDDMDAFKVRVEVDEHYITRVFINQTASFDHAGVTYKITVKKIYPEVKNGKFEVDMFFSGAVPSDIRRGQTLSIRLALGNLSEAILLSRGGFYQKTGGNWVYVVNDESGVAVKRSIKLGRQNPEFFEVLEGLKPGEKVITSNYDNFGENDQLIFNK